MTLDEAIKRYTSDAFYEKSDGNLQGCLEFKQLVDWLKELKRLREQEPILDKIRAEIIELRSKQNVGVLECLDILDKYKAESEDKE